MHWEGRTLTYHTNLDDTVKTTYTYNSEGIRTQRKIADITDGLAFVLYTYTLDGTKILSQFCRNAILKETYTLNFIYDENGNVTGFNDGTNTYFYQKNIQGDIIRILDVDGNVVVEYTYDAWGKILSITGTLADTIGQKNPFRYRSYYYDSETGWYYLNSRYYDPTVGRFINADGIIGANGGLQGYNMFAYCNNNPVMGYDPYGYCESLWATGWQGPCPGPGRCEDYADINEVDRDVTEEIDDALNSQIENISNYGEVLFSFPSLYTHLEFYLLVNHGKPWDIKLETPWQNTIKTPFPGEGTPVIYRGEVLTPADLGNYTYGYLGAAYGFPFIELLGGSYWAADFPTEGADLYHEVLIDWFYIQKGYVQYYIDNFLKMPEIVYPIYVD